MGNHPTGPAPCAGSRHLTADQAGQVERARAILAEEHEYDLAAMGRRIGKLEWWLSDMLRLVDQLAAR